MNNKTTLAVFILILAGVALFIFGLLGKPEKPQVGENGRVNGEYSLASIMSLDAPYRCTFTISGADSMVAGTVLTNGTDAYAEFRLSSSAVQNQFNSFLIIKDKKDSYIWTSLYPVGYQTKAASSATRNASAEEQAQIIGLEDKENYDCQPWQNPDNTVFDPPTWVQFSKI